MIFVVDGSAPTKQQEDSVFFWGHSIFSSPKGDAPNAMLALQRKRVAQLSVGTEHAAVVLNRCLFKSTAAELKANFFFFIRYSILSEIVDQSPPIILCLYRGLKLNTGVCEISDFRVKVILTLSQDLNTSLSTV